MEHSNSGEVWHLKSEIIHAIRGRVKDGNTRHVTWPCVIYSELISINCANIHISKLLQSSAI